jgi:WhiB family transcriptional regulator, redox-sensing transcriptional regulator
MTWRTRAACRGLDPEIFHPAPGESAAPARAVCASCPVRVECGEWALFREYHGVWGGLTERDRRRLRRTRRHHTTPVLVRSTSAAVEVGR